LGEPVPLVVHARDRIPPRIADVRFQNLAEIVEHVRQRPDLVAEEVSAQP
jgi:hypothetical protein